MRIRPCIDLHNGKVKQIVGSTLDSPDEETPQTNFSTDRSAAEFAALYRRDNLSGGHVIMLGEGNQAAAEAALIAYPGGLQVGGGITPENAEYWLRAGAEKVIVTSYLFTEGEFSFERLKEMQKTVGTERLVVDLSCRKVNDRYFVAARRWRETTNFELTAVNLEILNEYCREILIHGIDVEGKRQGIDRELVALLAEISPMAATYAGGVRNLEDLAAIRDTGKNKIDATVGSALDIFGGDLPYREVVRFDRHHRGREAKSEGRE